MRRLRLALLPFSLAALGLAPVASAQSTSAMRAAVDHTMRRIAFGPTATDLHSITTQAQLDAWVAQQIAGNQPWPAENTSIAALLNGPATLNGPDEIAPSSATQISHTWDEDKLAAMVLARAIWSPNQLREKVSVFWHQHFNTMTARLTGFYKNKFEHLRIENMQAQALAVYAEYKQFNAFREKGLSTFRELLEVSLNSSPMRIYLHSTQNSFVGDFPYNEDLSREFLELHTIGPENDQGEPNYTQDDIRDLARFITGWHVDTSMMQVAIRNDYQSHYFGSLHLFADLDYVADVTVAANPTASRGAMEARIDELIEKFANHDCTKTFVCRKLARYFVRDWEPSEVPKDLLTAMKAAWGQDGRIADILAVLFQHSEFTSRDAYKRLIKTPLESVASVMRLFDRPVFSSSPASVTKLGDMAHDVSIGMNQRLFRFISPDGYSIKSRDQAGAARALRRMRYAWRLYDDGHAGSKVSVLDLASLTGAGDTSSASSLELGAFELLLPGCHGPQDLSSAIEVLDEDIGEPGYWSDLIQSPSPVPVEIQRERVARLQLLASFIAGLRQVHSK